MSEASKKAREAMKSKIARLVRTDPKMKVDASGYTPPDALDADVQTGMRPISRRQFKKGGKVLKVQGEHARHHAGRKPRKSGGKALSANSLINRNVREANELRDGSKHVGGFSRGGSPKMQECPQCGGDGYTDASDFGDHGTHPCYACGTTGKVPENKMSESRRGIQKRERREAANQEMMVRAKSKKALPPHDDYNDIPFKRGGAAKHDDTAEDTKLIKKLVKPSAMKGHPKSCRCAKCSGGRMGRADGGKTPPINWSENEDIKPQTPPPSSKPAPSEPRTPLTWEQLKARGLDRNNPPKAPDNRKRGGRTGGKMSVSDGSLEGTRPTGGRLARKHGGNAGKGKMNVNIIIGTGHKGGMGAPAQGGLMPPPAGNPMAIPPGGPPPGGPPMPAGGLPMPPPPPAGGPPPMMGRKTGGRVAMYAPKQHGAGGGLGRLQKIKAYGDNAGHVVASKAK